MSLSGIAAPEAKGLPQLLRGGRLFSFAMLYHVIAWCARVAMHWCYRDAHLVGRIPAKGPVLLAVNHPNDLPDICAILGFVPRRVTFVANVTSAEQPIVAWAYRQMGVVAVHRVRDARRARARGLDSVSANAQAFDRVGELLAQGACVCVFPEGGVQRGTHLAPLRTGIARMALDAQAAGVRDLSIVPVGLVYESPLQPRSRMVAVAGEPLATDEWQPVAGRPAEPQLTAEIASRLRALTRNAPDTATAAVLGHLAGSVSALSSHPEPLLDGTCAWQAVTASTYGPGIAAEPDTDRRLEAVQVMARAFVASAGTGSASVAPPVSPGAAPSVERLLLAWRNGGGGIAQIVWEAPLAALGLVLHAPIWALIAVLARRSASIPAEVIPRRIVPGLYAMWSWYLLLFLVSAAALPFALPIAALLALAFTAAQPAFGTVALRWLDAVGDRRWRRWLLARVPDADAIIEASARCDRLHPLASDPMNERHTPRTTTVS